jgi:predicted kinase
MKGSTGDTASSVPKVESEYLAGNPAGSKDGGDSGLPPMADGAVSGDSAGSKDGGDPGLPPNADGAGSGDSGMSPSSVGAGTGDSAGSKDGGDPGLPPKADGAGSGDSGISPSSVGAGSGTSGISLSGDGAASGAASGRPYTGDMVQPGSISEQSGMSAYSSGGDRIAAAGGATNQPSGDAMSSPVSVSGDQSSIDYGAASTSHPSGDQQIQAGMHSASANLGGAASAGDQSAVGSGAHAVSGETSMGGAVSPQGFSRQSASAGDVGLGANSTASGDQSTSGVSPVGGDGGSLGAVSSDRTSAPEQKESMGDKSPENQLSNILTPHEIQKMEDMIETQKSVPVTDLSEKELADLTSKHYGEGAAVKERRLDLVVGPPGSGKSSNLVNPLAKENGSLVIDADAVKPDIRGYMDGLGAEAVHEASSQVAHQVLVNALKNGDNIVVPKLGANAERLVPLIDAAKGLGYSVNLHLADLPHEVSARRVFDRAFPQDGSVGQWVNPKFAHETGTKPQEAFESLISRPGLIDGYTHHDMNVPRGEAPRLVKSSMERRALAGVR